MTTTPQLATGHVGINVTDLDRSVAFYRNALGFEPLALSGEGEHRYAFLGTDGTLRLTLWQQSNGRFSPETPGLHHLSFEAASIDEVRSVEATLKALDVEFAYDGVVAHGEGASSGGIFFTDPDGTRLEVYAPSGAHTAPAPNGAAPTCGFF
ncbi:MULTISPECIES: VOC family protein [unclassified Mycolicibacterium]|uniref:VOC family protein n=1 Tax=unclassified Mycolicibacterium TaxID=2636767 RepID=UPI0012DF5EE4|nr:MULTISPECIES: VOC family protein [unclassified Mycolicibacterium]MUL85346.1 VOC family protein [Mycolicibacterium sp. CBMA 329]MUL88890.1 VOC family protein [Mycolicibacterium sp. CBMA 331]MUM01836.1 VOC family protein [Mycolicibacterium sp. CBMA 334]MUM30099.1 VOC family protein [Mycolicibacterium sp. CBMA 295]MUM40537.1 VOC family protein [Mycolicibacterium sp. CBMA 247]